MSETKAVERRSILTPQQEYFLSLYTDPKSPTFGNAYQSAVKAKYSPEYAESLTSQLPNWLSENLGRMRLLAKAEKNLEEMLDLPQKVQAMGRFGPLWDGKGKGRKPIMAYASTLIKVKNDASQFVAETIGKSAYAKRSEQGENSREPFTVKIVVYGQGNNDTPQFQGTD